METPLTVQSAFESWRWDTSTVVLTVALGAGYWAARSRAARRGTVIPAGRLAAFALMGLGLWLLSGISMVGVYSDTLMWVRALQTLLLLYVVPFGLASGRPFTVLREALGPHGQARLDRILASTLARAVTFPLAPSLAMLAVPWLLFLSPWYEIVLRHGIADTFTRIALVAIGFVYFYSRLQTDPVPHRYSQGLSLLITVFESLADGILGIVLWWGPLVALGYYTEVGRTWGPDLRMDQTIAAGIIWVLGDVLGLPYLLALMRAWASDERRKAAEVDAELDAAEATVATASPARRQKFSRSSDAAVAAKSDAVQSGLWWENDPQLRQRFGR
ncbi:cytochrome c oxidase assembly protein [Nocardia vaccinii]|uniref:cytochrome c oxidase assembly protein n=1 Tax=Nocardia vaccinii TaxID=1822 RepID=UPI000A0349FF|nr:cytochrome c oxidase assembly protein [Nocardia vaccinii]